MMKLRHILLLLTILAFGSAACGGYVFFFSLEKNIRQDNEKKAALHSAAITSRVESFLTDQHRTIRVLAGIATIEQGASQPENSHAIQASHQTLDHFATSLDVDVCYIMDTTGTVIATSNREAAKSFLGKNFSFRPYFKTAMQHKPGFYMALGATSGKRGVYYSYPITTTEEIIGVAVIKTSIANLEQQFESELGETSLLVDPHGIIFIASKRKLLFTSLHPLSTEMQQAIATSRQFGPGPWQWSKLDLTSSNLSYNEKPLDKFPGWRFIYLHQPPHTGLIFWKSLFKFPGFFALPLLLLVSSAIYILYHQAKREIIGRRDAEQSLRENEQRYRTLYHHTPAMLHSIDPEGRLLSVSDYWLDVMGYERHEVVGQRFSSFMAAASRDYAESVVLPQFLATGECRNIEYQYITKEGQHIDVVLSAIAERNPDQSIKRSLAVLLDVTRLKQTEARLKQVTEDLAHYSKDLEQQVRKRTRKLQKLSTQIITTQEQERGALARELHDELGQILTAFRFDTVWLHERLKETDPRASERALILCDLVDKTIDEVRNLALRLRPGVLDDLGLTPALEWLAADFEKRTSCSCTVKKHVELVVDDLIATTVYRVTQECLTNIARHAKAGRVSIELDLYQDELSLIISDDGTGMCVDKQNPMEGMGLQTIRERAELAGGTISLHSELNKGSRITLKVPTQLLDP